MGDESHAHLITYQFGCVYRWCTVQWSQSLAEWKIPVIMAWVYFTSVCLSRRVSVEVKSHARGAPLQRSILGSGLQEIQPNPHLEPSSRPVAFARQKRNTKVSLNSYRIKAVYQSHTS